MRDNLINLLFLFEHFASVLSIKICGWGKQKHKRLTKGFLLVKERAKQRNATIDDTKETDA